MQILASYLAMNLIANMAEFKFFAECHGVELFAYLWLTMLKNPRKQAEFYG